VGALLVTYNFDQEYIVTYLNRFARSLCRNFATLQAKGHPKWREVSLSFPELRPGWAYYEPTTKEIRACLGKTGASAPAKTTKQCSAEERILGFCN